MARTTTKTAEQPKNKAPVRGAGAKGATKADNAAVEAEAAAPAKAGQPSAGAKKAAAPQPPPKPAKARVVTLKHLAAGVAEKRNAPMGEIWLVASSLIDDLVEQVKDGARVKIAGLGVIEVKNRPARMGRNPATGEPVQVAASRKLAFRAAKELKEAI